MKQSHFLFFGDFQDFFTVVMSKMEFALIFVAFLCRFAGKKNTINHYLLV